MCLERPTEQILCSVMTRYKESHSPTQKGQGDELGEKSLHPLDKFTLSGASESASGARARTLRGPPSSMPVNTTPWALRVFRV